ncbi:MAG: PcfB family protein [Mobilitalea sp.]
MQEEVTNKTIALVFRTTKLTAETLKKAIQMYLEYQKGKTQNNHGKISVKKLVGQNAGVSSIEVTDNNIKQFEKVAKKYSVDFSIKKDKTVDPPKYMVFFKGRDADVISQAFKEFVKVNEKVKQRESVKQKLQKLVKVVAQNKNKERSREKDKDRGQSL